MSERTLPPFKSLQDGDRITIVGTVHMVHGYPGVVSLIIANGEEFTIGSADYESGCVKVERPTWTEVTA